MRDLPGSAARAGLVGAAARRPARAAAARRPTRAAAARRGEALGPRVGAAAGVLRPAAA